MSHKDYEPVDLARAGIQIHQLESMEIDNIENAFAGYVREVLGQINVGKEATVYLCAGVDESLLAAKMFKPKNFRSFNNDRRYRNFGKQRDRRMAKAMKQRSRRGEQAFHDHWVKSEWQMLNRLYDLGVNVPKPISDSVGGVLMAFIGDGYGAAPRLVNADLSEQETLDCADQLSQDIHRMLADQIVHGDLSAYNILWHKGRAVIIDVPQAMELNTTPDAWSMMHRDLSNLDEFFQKRGAETRLVDLLYQY